MIRAARTLQHKGGGHNTMRALIINAEYRTVSEVNFTGD
jgi:hypothetical protein